MLNLPKTLGLTLLGAALSTAIATAVWAAQPLFVAYPPNNHITTADRIFLMGTAPPTGNVLVNGKPITRNRVGHFAPSFPLQMGENRFTLQYDNQTLQLRVVRDSSEPAIPPGAGFAPGSLTPTAQITRLSDEWLCFTAIAPPNAQVKVKLADQVIPLQSASELKDLPENLAVLTGQNQPTRGGDRYQGCTRPVLLGDLGQPQYEVTLNGTTQSQVAPGKVTILSPSQLEVAEVTVEAGVARTGPSTDYSRLTPLPKGTQSLITGSEGGWLRLDYGGWIQQKEVQIRQRSVPPQSLIRSISARQVPGWTEVVFPLQVPVPMQIKQGDRTFTLRLYNTTAQTDIIRLDDDPVISRLDWSQVEPGQVEYTFNLKSAQQWGYRLRYEGTSLVLALRHPPGLPSRQGAKPLTGAKILLDPGHGGPDDLGARGPTGYPEKQVALVMGKLVEQELTQRGATVYLTRRKDVDLPLQDRVNAINQFQPNLALSLHYNALPDNGDALRTQGIATFWYHPQAHNLAIFLHNYLVETLDRPSYGVFWNNLALTRPSVTPAVLLELGFMINPDEFVWITNRQEQQRLARAIADGVTKWLTAQPMPGK